MIIAVAVAVDGGAERVFDVVTDHLWLARTTAYRWVYGLASLDDLSLDASARVVHAATRGLETAAPADYDVLGPETWPIRPAAGAQAQTLTDDSVLVRLSPHEARHLMGLLDGALPLGRRVRRRIELKLEG